MANLNINNYHNLKFRINYDEYWDFYVCKDFVTPGYFDASGINLYDECLISDIDMGNSECVSDDGTWIYSHPAYSWSKAVSSGKTLTNISYCGVDNGLFAFRKDRITNKDFVDLFQSFKYELSENDYRLKLHKVSGSTLQYEYPLSLDNEGVKLNGGFYQGFFKTKCGEYDILPSKFAAGDTVNFEFLLKRENLEKESNKTLNDRYPNNKGIFFYLGTRAENKWIYWYDKEDKDSLEGCFALDISDFVEDAEINKEDYIIGNFYDVNPDFDGYDPFELGDYTNYRYYDEPQYEDDYCNWSDMDYYIDLNPYVGAKTIPDDAPYQTLENCCGGDAPKSQETAREPFYSFCACKIMYRKKSAVETDSDSSVNGCDAFGEDGYIDDFGGLDSIDESRTYLENELDITDFEYYDSNGLPLNEANWYYFYTDNKFMMFDRTKDGYTVKNWIEGTQMMYCGRKSKYTTNLFIVMNRTKTGYTIENVDELKEENANSYNPYNDIYDNAIAFRIQDDGSIGYRLLTYDCSISSRDKSSILEGYSLPNIVPLDEWCSICVRMSFILDKMKLLFYVDGKLKYVTDDLPPIRLRELNDLLEKQEGVPYNISIGGGTQGLAEIIQYNYMLNPSRVYPIEKNFAGSFIGHIRLFRMSDCSMEQMLIMNNSKYDKKMSSH